MKKLLKNLIKNKLALIVLVVFFILYTYFHLGIVYVPAEKLNIPIGVGFDRVQHDDGRSEFILPVTFYNFADEEKVKSFIFVGKGVSLVEAKEDLQSFSNKMILPGLEKVLILSERFSKYSIREVIDYTFKNQITNDNAYIVVSKGDLLDTLNFEVEGFPSSADYIEGMISNYVEANFFSEKYKTIDIFLALDAEGKSIVLPYIEIKDEKLKITGLALFKEDKMVTNIDIEKAKALNLLREDNVRGIVTIDENEKSISYNAMSKRNVKCEKKGEKYVFTIDITLTGEIIYNSLYPGISDSEQMLNKFEKKMEKYIEESANDFIKEMKENYKVDCLSLGQIAAGEYGRQTGIDWNRVVTKSDIIVNVKVEVDRMGRGDY